MTGKRRCGLSTRDLYLLNEVCRQIDEALGMPYLVGTAATDQDYRDVDVRVLLDDDEPHAYAQFGPLTAYPRAQRTRELYPALHPRQRTTP